MAEPTKREAVGLLRRLRDRADREGSWLPALASVSSGSTAAACGVAHDALVEAGYYLGEVSFRAGRVATIDRAIRSLEAADV